MTWTLLPVVGALALAALPAVADAQEADAAELAEARAIVEVMFPPASREQSLQTMIEQISGQVEQAMPFDVAAFGDAGLTKMVEGFRASVIDELMPIVQVHFPHILEATAVAYTHEFDLAELRDIRAFAETPSGGRYLSRSAALIGDPAVAEANTAYFRELQAVSATRQAEFAEQLRAYFIEHPDLARKVAEVGRGN